MATGQKGLPALTEDTIRELLAVQKQELALRLEEVTRDKADIAHSQSIANFSVSGLARRLCAAIQSWRNFAPLLTLFVHCTTQNV